MLVNEINCETKADIVREATESEIFTIDAAKTESNEIAAQLENIAVQKEALLSKLGITVDEAKLLLT